MKTKETLRLEQAILNHFDKIGTLACVEVKIGNTTSKSILTDKTEIVDVMVYEPTTTVRCLEIKTSLSDFKSKQALSFYGDYNYLVIPDYLPDQIKGLDAFKDVLWNGIGVITINETSKLTTYRKAKKKTLSFGTRAILLESMTRSLARDAKKYYQHYYKRLENK